MTPSTATITWDCKRDGCFNEVKRLKFAELAVALEGEKTGFSDIDGITERKGNLLVIEWKPSESVPTGQLILFENWTRYSPATVFMVAGDAQDMSVRSVAIVYKGEIGAWRPATLDELRRMIRMWWKWAEAHPQGG